MRDVGDDDTVAILRGCGIRSPNHQKTIAPAKSPRMLVDLTASAGWQEAPKQQTPTSTDRNRRDGSPKSYQNAMAQVSGLKLIDEMASMKQQNAALQKENRSVQKKLAELQAKSSVAVANGSDEFAVQLAKNDKKLQVRCVIRIPSLVCLHTQCVLLVLLLENKQKEGK